MSTRGCRGYCDHQVAASTAQPYNPFVRVLFNKYEHGGARFYTVDEHGARRLLADTYNAEATARVADALSAEVT